VSIENHWDCVSTNKFWDLGQKIFGVMEVIHQLHKFEMTIDAGAGDDGNDNDNELVEGRENNDNKKSERKRKREKQRRNDLTIAFDELAAFIVKVDPEPGESTRKRKKTDKGGEAESSGITRLDLITRTLRLLRRLHRENDEMRHFLEQRRGEGGSGNDNVRLRSVQFPVL
jgi:hypothetical protein